MSNVAKLKKQAAEFEQKKQFDKALAVYVKLLGAFDEHAAELDVALFNRVGDLMLRQGNVADALDYYEQAVDRYSDTGFFNNAIALCNKILRASPGRASIYYKLGKISAHKGFKNDAKVNFLEYADRMQKGGNVNEAFRALKEFADLCPDQDEIRLMLADQLTKVDRKGEAIDQLQILHARYEAEGRVTDASAIADRIHQIDPSVELKSDGGTATSRKSSDLIFLDLDAPVGTPSRASMSIPPSTVPQPPRRTPTPPRAVTPPRAGTPAAPSTPALPLTPPTSRTPATPATPFTPPTAATPVAPLSSLTPPIPATPINSEIVDEDLSPPEAQFTRADIALDGPEADTLDAPLSGLSRIDDDAIAFQETPSQSLHGLESTRLADDDLIRSTPSSSLLDLEPTSLGEAPPVHRSNAPTQANREETTLGEDLTFDLPPAQPTPIRSAAQPSIDFDHNALLTPLKGGPLVPPRHAVPQTPSPLDGLPLMDLDVPVPPTPAKSRTPSSLEEITFSDELELLGDNEPAPAIARSLDVSVGGSSSAIDALDDLDIADASDGDDDLIATPTPPRSNRSTLVAMQAVEALKADVEAEPTNWARHRELAEAMLEAGVRDDAILELETAMNGAERAGDLEFASALAEELARLEPESVKHHQKRVEYAFRTNNRPRLIEAYVSLGDSLLRAEQTDKARTVYQRVIDLAPDEVRAKAALDSLALPLPEVTSLSGDIGSQQPSTATMGGAAVPTAPAAGGRSADFVNLGDWLRDAPAPKDTRMVVAEQEPSGDEEADFADMLRKFKQGVAENVDAEDYQSHYDLAIAFKEMGLLDEAIAEFQKALGSPTNRLPTYEALGQCFIEKSQPRLAMSVLTRALNEAANEEQLIGVLYLLGRAAEELGLATDALAYYQRVFVQDIQFRDIADRMSEVERAIR